MFRLIGRSLLSLLVVLQAVQPTLACPCQSVEVVAIESTCGCEVETVIESECGCETSEAFVDSCESCGNEAQTTKPLPAETKKTKTEEPAVTPQPALPPSTTEDIGPAPINVPSDPATDTATEPAVTSPTGTEELFPGPAATDPTTPAVTVPATSTPSETAPTTEPAPPTTNTEGLFDEPAAEPVDSTPSEDTESSTTTEELFVEPSQSAEASEEAVTESTETEAEETPPAGDPLDELFSPSTPATDPAPEASPADDTESDSTEAEETETPAADQFDPFSQNKLPSELRAPGGLASQEYRGWSDRTNNFLVSARLVRMSADGVFLADQAGEYIAMSFSQLRDSDLSFVRDQVRAKRMVLAKQKSTLVARAAN
jgi:hypothetical protein